jgi:hypothetical protein
MFNAKWKFLVVSIVIYQAILTWCLFDLVNTAAYLARTECGDWCRDRLFGFILTNQGGSDTANLFAGASLLLIAANVIVWVVAARKGRGGKDQASG